LPSSFGEETKIIRHRGKQHSVYKKGENFDDINGCMLLRILKKASNFNGMVEENYLSFEGVKHAFLEFSNKQ
jgi:hypothetical protein